MMAGDKLTARIESGLSTVRAWEADPKLLSECRSQIPFSELCPEQTNPSKWKSSSNSNDTVNDANPYSKAEDDEHYEGDDLLLKRMAVFFKKSMKWVNNPPCQSCGCKDTACIATRGPITAEEREGGASRVEVYRCPACKSEETTFPRYNSPRKLLQTRRGRCGEYANLFGLFCRAAGFETRYILDFTDHVWIEVYSHRLSRWIMADGCEGQIDSPSMYEKGWGKKLSYVLAFTHDSVTDVTRRYTRQFQSLDFRRRRLEFCSSELQSDMIIAQVNASIRTKYNLKQTRIDELDKRAQLETQFFQQTQNDTSWTNDDYGQGRISGSLAWRSARGENGTSNSPNNETTHNQTNDTRHHKPPSSNYYHIESFHPTPYSTQNGNHTCIICVSAPPSPHPPSFPQCIRVSGVACGAGLPNSISVVIVDETLGCILQSRFFSDLDDASLFLASVPDGRIVAVSCHLGSAGLQYTDGLKKLARRLGGIEDVVDPHSLEMKGTDCDTARHLLFVGQIQYHPPWAICKVSGPGATATVAIDIQPTPKPESLKLKRELDTIPNAISGRLPERIMPLQTQLLANEIQKRKAFLEFIQNEQEGDPTDSRVYVGYATKDNAPIYLFTKDAFPLRRWVGSGAKSDGEGSFWKTYHYLPEPLVPANDEITNDPPTEQNQAPKFDVPANEDFFTTLLGPKLLKNNSGTNQTSTIDTEIALCNSRLVALYFSAHWCPPCRQFTPLLCEFYNHLKVTEPSHGLEIIFVSSDRDSSSFQHYFDTMPWLSIPYETGLYQQQAISARFGIQGIPALLVLDTVSGQIVISKEQSRSDVGNACRGGDSAIEDLLRNKWMDSISSESKMIYETLKLSCEDEEEDEDGMTTENDSNPYLVRKDPIENEEIVPHKNEETQTKDLDYSALVKEYFTDLVAKGTPPNEAAAQAIKAVATQQQQSDASMQSTALSNGNTSGKIVEENQSQCDNTSSNDKEAQTKEVDYSALVKQYFADFVARGTPPNQAAAQAIKAVAEKEHQNNASLQSPALNTDKEAKTKEVDYSALVKKYFADLVANGTPPNQAAAQAIKAVANMEQEKVIPLEGPSLSTGNTSGEIVKEESQSNNNYASWHSIDLSVAANVIKIAKKYLDNVRKNPSDPKYRNFKISNKVFDKIASSQDGLDIITRFGFSIYCNDSDFMACIPLAADLVAMNDVIDNFLDENKS